MAKKIDITYTHLKYAEMSWYWQTMEDVTASALVVRAAGDRYVPKLDGMTDAQFLAYCNRASFPLFTKHTLRNFVGMSMRKDVMTNNVPDYLIKNINGKGTALTEFVKRLVNHYLKMGRCGTMVEFSRGRPKLLLYDATSIMDWQTRIIDDVEVLSMVKLREQIDESSDSYQSQTTYQYRVLMLDESKGNTYVQEVYDGEGELLRRFEPRQSHRAMKFIPFIIHGGWEVDYPPLLQIAEQNLNWYSLDADYKHGLHYVALPTPYTIGVDDPKLRPKTLGVSKMWHLPDGSKVGLLEFTGAGLGEFITAKKECHDHIVTLSSRILAPPMNLNETATAAAIRNAGDTASLAEIVGMLSRELSECLTMAVTWKSRQTGGEIWAAINNDFIPTILSGSDVASYVASYLKGGISFHTLFQVLKRGEIQEGDRQLAEELNDIRDEILQRQVDEVSLANKLAEINARLERRQGDPNYMAQGKDGEQSNKGQDFDEN